MDEQESSRPEPEQAAPPANDGERRRRTELGVTSRRLGYVATVFINMALLYLANNLVAWDLPFLTDGFIAVLWVINLSLFAGMIGNLLLLVYDPLSFRRLVRISLNVVSFTAVYAVFTIFPFAFGPGTMDVLVRIALLATMTGIVIATGVEVVRFVSGR
jgi:hypothetical protein